MSDKHVSDENLSLMLAKSYEKLEAARRDFDAGSYSEVSSRSYYAVFHAISAVLASKGLSFSSHSQVLGAFNREFVKSGIFPHDTFRKIQRLFENRQIGDYDVLTRIDRKTAGKDIEDASWLISECQKILGL
jgi:uncharacterized protein (UPF0332 family)